MFHTLSITICTLDETPAQLILMHVCCAVWGWETNTRMHTRMHLGERFAKNYKKNKIKLNFNASLMVVQQWLKFPFKVNKNIVGSVKET